MKKWILKDEWLFQTFVTKERPRQIRVKPCGIQKKDMELARGLARIMELWSERS